MARANRIKDPRQRHDNLIKVLENKVFRLDNSDDSAELYLMGVVADDFNQWDDSDITPAKVIAALKEADGKDMSIYLNTPGGSVYAGAAINAALSRYDGQLTIYADGIVASAGTWFLDPAQHVVVSQMSLMMIHPAQGFGWGDADSLRAEADVLDKIGGQMLAMYKSVTAARGKTYTDEELTAAIKKESWFTAEEAVEFGLADEVAAASAKQPKTNLADSGGNIDSSDAKRHNSLAIARAEHAIFKINKSITGRGA